MSDAVGNRPIHFYDEAAGLCHPTDLAVGPWDRRFQNGVAIAALLAHLAERAPCPAPMVIVRFVLDIVRPTPMQPVAARSRVVREGKRLQLLEIELLHEDRVTARASVLRVRDGASPGTARQVFADPPDGLPPLNARSSIGHVLETRLESGGLEERGDGVVWVRVKGEITAGTPITPFVQAAMAADLGSGLSSFVDWREWTFANVDITLYLTRYPAPGWLRLAAHSDGAGNGIAIVDTRMADADGTLGQAHQTLFLDAVPQKTG